MSGHSKWSQIKHRKEAADQKRGAAFSKLLRAISVAARGNPNPDFNPRLRAAVEKAKEANVPNETLARAISRSSEEKVLEEMTLEAHGPEGSAIIVEAVTDNRNRTIAELKHLFSENDAKLGEQGSARWAFDPPDNGADSWRPKFKQELSPEARRQLDALVAALEERDDVQRVITNVTKN